MKTSFSKNDDFDFLRPKRPEKKRLAVGYLMPWIMALAVNNKRLNGLRDQANARNVDLLCFLGGPVNNTSDYYYQAHVLYPLITRTHIDGLIVDNIFPTGNPIVEEEIRAFLKRFGVPIVTIRRYLFDIPYVPLDNAAGMRQLLAHLIEFHKYKKIAFLRGPAEHSYSIERLAAFEAVLQEYGIGVDQRLVTPPLSWSQSGLAVLLDERGLVPGRDFQVIVSVNDKKALDAEKILRARGFGVPQDVAVTGFNNELYSATVDTTITTVQLPFYQQGRDAIDMVLALINGEKNMPASAPLTLIIRESCGCDTPSLCGRDPGGSSVPVGSQAPSAPEEKSKTTLHDAIMSSCGRNWKDDLENILSPVCTDLVTAFSGQVLKAGAPGRFLEIFSDLMDLLLANGSNLSEMEGFISRFRNASLTFLEDKGRVRAEDLLHQTRIMLAHKMHLISLKETQVLGNEEEIIREIGQIPVSAANLGRFLDLAADKLIELGINTFYLALFEKHAFCVSPMAAPPWSRLVLACEEGKKLAIDEAHNRFLTAMIIPDGFNFEKRSSFIVQVLYFQDHLQGLLILEANARREGLYERIRREISSVLAGLIAFEEQERIKQALLRSNRELEQYAEVVSHDLQEPLRKVIMFADRLAGSDGEAFSEQGRWYWEKVQTSARRMQRLIRDLLEYSRATTRTPRLETVDLLKVFHKATAELSETIKAAGASVEAGELSVIQADPLEMEQLFRNIIDNSLKFRRPDIRPQVRVESRIVDNVLCEIEFSDNGTGISPGQRGRVFELFERLEPQGDIEGSGIGLAICRMIVERHEGEISVDAGPDGGSVFKIRIPLVSMRAEA